MKKKREENVELADIQAVRERMTQWAIRLCLLLISAIARPSADSRYRRHHPVDAGGIHREGWQFHRADCLSADIDGCGLCGVSSKFGKKILGKVPANPPDGQSAD